MKVNIYAFEKKAYTKPVEILVEFLLYIKKLDKK